MKKNSLIFCRAFAWDNSDFVGVTELHSESGFLAGSDNSSLVAMNTVMSNGGCCIFFVKFK
jgi:hypothetical protein